MGISKIFFFSFFPSLFSLLQPVCARRCSKYKHKHSLESRLDCRLGSWKAMKEEVTSEKELHEQLDFATFFPFPFLPFSSFLLKPELKMSRGREGLKHSLIKALWPLPHSVSFKLNLQKNVACANKCLHTVSGVCRLSGAHPAVPD